MPSLFTPLAFVTTTWNVTNSALCAASWATVLLLSSSAVGLPPTSCRQLSTRSSETHFFASSLSAEEEKIASRTMSVVTNSVVMRVMQNLATDRKSMIGARSSFRLMLANKPETLTAKKLPRFTRYTIRSRKMTMRTTAQSSHMFCRLVAISNSFSKRFGFRVSIMMLALQRSMILHMAMQNVAKLKAVCDTNWPMMARVKSMGGRDDTTATVSKCPVSEDVGMTCLTFTTPATSPSTTEKMESARVLQTAMTP
mmetsp:Transcript_26527/g.61878  ORF Transcript_26527/g.61878 Transcript_26527/m.61878 type:complete len:254 (+) Transcript_26527:315-1076(+)